MALFPSSSVALVVGPGVPGFILESGGTQAASVAAATTKPACPKNLRLVIYSYSGVISDDLGVFGFTVFMIIFVPITNNINH